MAFHLFLTTPINRGRKRNRAIKETINPPIVPAARGNQKASLNSPIIKGIKPNIVEKIVKKIGLTLAFHARKYARIDDTLLSASIMLLYSFKI